MTIETAAVRGTATQGVAWVLCPVCRKCKVLKLGPGTEATALIVHCKRCGQESVIDVTPEAGGHRVQLTTSA